jgi:hypothetical protein
MARAYKCSNKGKKETVEIGKVMVTVTIKQKVWQKVSATPSQQINWHGGSL